MRDEDEKKHGVPEDIHLVLGEVVLHGVSRELLHRQVHDLVHVLLKGQYNEILIFRKTNTIHVFYACKYKCSLCGL